MSAIEPARLRATAPNPGLLASTPATSSLAVLILAVLILTVLSLAGAARAEHCGDDKVLIAYRVEGLESEIGFVRISFEIVDTDSGPEWFTLKIFDAGSASPFEDAEILAEKTFFVESSDHVLPGQVRIGAPPVLTKWEVVVFESPVMVHSESALIAVEMSIDQLRQAGVVAFLEETCDENRAAYYSENNGQSWGVLDQAKLDCLRNTESGLDGSTYIRVHVQGG